MPTQQSRVLETFLALCSARGTWAGALLLGVGLDGAGRALALACLAAGSAGLFLEDDRTELRLAQREGCCSFSVTTLEEAVRALKNEVRQKRAVTVALSGAPHVWLQEMVTRGLQPQAVAFSAEPQPADAESVSVLEQRGSQVLHGLGLATWRGGVDLDAHLNRATGDWTIRTDSAQTVIDRRNQDRKLFAAIGGPGTPTARAASRWLRVAPSLFPRSLDRVYLHRQS